MGKNPLVFHTTDRNVLVAPPTCGLLALPDFLNQVRRWCETEAEGAMLVVDLSAVEELEMTMFRTLLWARRYCTARGRELVVVPTADGVLQPEDEPMVHALLPTRSAASGVQPALPDPAHSVVPA